MSVNEAKAKYLEAKKAVASCQGSIAELTGKVVSLEESLPGLTRAVEEAGKAKVSALDAFALNTNKTTEVTLKGAREAYDNTQKKLAETHELAEATHRALKKMESEFVRLNNASEMAKRQVWEAISESYESKITDEDKEYVAIITTIGSQLGRPRQYVLDYLFKYPTHDDVLEIQRNLREEYNID